MSVPVVLERNNAYTYGPDGIQPKRLRVYILPTRQGILYGAMLIVMLLGAINYSNSMAFMLCFLLASLGIVCMLHTYRNLAGLVLASEKAAPVFAGQQALFPLRLHNPEQKDRFAIRIDTLIKEDRLFRRAVTTTVAICSPPPNKHTVVTVPIPTLHRGFMTPGKLRIETCFPLGIFRAWSYFTSDDSCLVYPAAAGKSQLPAKSMTGESSSAGNTNGVEDFSGFRKYQPGDAANSIAWKHYAREQGLLIKQFSGSGKAILRLSWEQVLPLNTIEAKLSQLCLWILAAEENGVHYALVLPGIIIDAGSGEKHKHRCLKQLALFS